MTLHIGEKVPSITLPASSGKEISLEDYKGKNIVLYFYPKDMTPGCTTEACDFRDLSEEWEKANAVILGVSPDPLKKHEAFIEKHGLPFPLLSDEEKTAAEAFGVWQLKKTFGKEYMGIVRSTFLINEEGILVKEWRNVRVKNHAEQVLHSLKESSGHEG